MCSLDLLAVDRPVGKVATFVVALNFLNDVVHLTGLLLPQVLGHFGLFLEELGIWFAITSSQSIPEGGELAIVDVEVQMMPGVAGSAIDDGRVGVILSVVDEDGPEVDEAKEPDEGELLQGEDERKEVVGDGLSETVDRMESVRGVRCWDDPFVMWLVKGLVD